MKASVLLAKKGHELQSTLKRLRKGRGHTDELLKQLSRDISGYMLVEQQLLYPRALKQEHAFVLEGIERHVLMQFTLKRLVHISLSDPTFISKVSVLEALTRHHIRAEARGIFHKLETRLGRKSKPLCKEMHKLLRKAGRGGHDKPADGRSAPRRSEA
jgi:hypothetical protein